MDSLTLVQEARAAGLVLTADGDRLVVRGPRSAARVAERVVANKAAVLAVLTGSTPAAAPPQPVARPSSGPVRCATCNLERNATIPDCPRCHLTPTLPATCIATIACTVLGPCPRFAQGHHCLVSTSEEATPCPS